MHTFSDRHVGIDTPSEQKILEALKLPSIKALIDKTIPENIRLKKPFQVCEPTSEYEYEKHMHEIASQNKCAVNFMGQGYYGTITPSVIKRNILENPGWYTAYTPYQAEISQGRLEGLLNFQTMIANGVGTCKASRGVGWLCVTWGTHVGLEWTPCFNRHLC